MLLNAVDILMNNKIEDPFPLLFKPVVHSLYEDQIELNYPLRQIQYQGSYLKKDGLGIIRNGYGKMIKNVAGKMTTLVSCNWENDLPNT
jgi:hypothetical protein